MELKFEIYKVSSKTVKFKSHLYGIEISKTK